MKVRYTVRSRAQAKQEIDWWRKHRQDSPELAFDDLRLAIERIQKFARVPKPYGRLEGELVWRIQTRSTRLHVYYTIDEANQIAHIEYVWGARRGATPPLDEP